MDYLVIGGETETSRTNYAANQYFNNKEQNIESKILVSGSHFWRTKPMMISEAEHMKIKLLNFGVPKTAIIPIEGAVFNGVEYKIQDILGHLCFTQPKIKELNLKDLVVITDKGHELIEHLGDYLKNGAKLNSLTFEYANKTLDFKTKTQLNILEWILRFDLKNIASDDEALFKEYVINLPIYSKNPNKSLYGTLLKLMK